MIQESDLTAYSAITFSALEQPTLAKWNILGSNDAFFNSQIGALFGSGTTSKVWWEELGRTELSGADDTISVTSLPARKHLYVYVSALATGGTIGTQLRFNNDSGANYAWRRSANGAADGTAVSQTYLNDTSLMANMFILEATITNISGQEHIGNTVVSNAGTAGAGNAPNRLEGSAKWATTSQITRIDCLNVGTGNFAIGSLMVVLGHD